MARSRATMCLGDVMEAIIGALYLDMGWKPREP